MSEIGEWVDITRMAGTCVFCERVIFLPGESAPSVRTIVLKHTRDCPQHPMRGFNPRKYKDDARGADEGTLPYRSGRT